MGLPLCEGEKKKIMTVWGPASPNTLAHHLMWWRALDCFIRWRRKYVIPREHAHRCPVKRYSSQAQCWMWSYRMTYDIMNIKWDAGGHEINSARHNGGGQRSTGCKLCALFWTFLAARSSSRRDYKNSREESGVDELRRLKKKRNDDWENGKCNRSARGVKGEDERWSKTRRGNKGEAGEEGGWEEKAKASARGHLLYIRQRHPPSSSSSTSSLPSSASSSSFSSSCLQNPFSDICLSSRHIFIFHSLPWFLFFLSLEFHHSFLPCSSCIGYLRASSSASHRAACRHSMSGCVLAIQAGV